MEKFQKEIREKLGDLQNGQQEIKNMFLQTNSFYPNNSYQILLECVKNDRKSEQLGEMNCTGISRNTHSFLSPIIQMHVMTQKKLLTNSSEEQ